MDNTEDENISLLLSMGFPDISEIKRALQMAKNDLNEAVALLTNEQAFSPSDSSSFRPASSLSTGDRNETDSNVFPEGYLYELESRVFTDQWSIPYKRDESLGKCLEAAARLTVEGLHEADENCRRFVERCLPESMRKLLDSHAVKRWGGEIQRGIYTMLELFIDFLVPRLKHDPVPNQLLNILALALDIDCEYNAKNRNQLANAEQWDEAFGSSNMYYALSPSNPSKDPYGWLVDILNYFGSKDGFQAIQNVFAKDDLDFEQMDALLQPFSKCAEFLNPIKIKPYLGTCMSKAFNAVKKLDEKDLKSKNVAAALDVLVALKCLCGTMYPTQNVNIDDMRLEIVLKMMKIPHFATRMNALKEVSKFVEESGLASYKKGVIPADKVLEWIAKNKVMTIALEGNIDHIQYTERIKNLLEFLGPKLSKEDLTHIWALADRQTSYQAVDNIYGIIAPASAKFVPELFEHLLFLIQDKWKMSGDRNKERLVNLLSQIGKEGRYNKTSPRVLEVLWEMIHCNSLPPNLILRGLDAHSSILSELPAKENIRQLYMTHCMDNIKEGRNVYISVLYLQNLLKNLTGGRDQYYKAERTTIMNLNRQHDLISLFTKSLMKSHKMAVMSAHSQNTLLTPKTMVEMKFTHQQILHVHLQAIDYALKEIRLDFPWTLCKELWDTLVTNPDACESDRETCFEWFNECLPDLEASTQVQLFKEKLLSLDPVSLTMRGFHCLRMYFESVNVTEEKFRRYNNTLVVDKLEPTGIEFFWQVALLCRDDEVAEETIFIIHECVYHSLDSKLKKDSVRLHQRFINECYKRLESSMGLKEGENLSSTLKCFSALPEAMKECYVQQIVRLLILLEKYIVGIEEGHLSPRAVLPHGASYKGEPVTLHIFCEDAKTELTVDTHTNETVWALRRRISVSLGMEPDQITLVMNGDQILQPNKDQKLIKQIGLMETPTLVVKDSVCSATVASGAKVTELRDIPTCPSPMSVEDVENVTDSESAGRAAYLLEMEEMLPGVVIAQSGKVFEILYTLAELNVDKITEAVRRVISLIPTDPSVCDTLQKVATFTEKAAAASNRLGIFRSNSSSGIKVPPRPVGSHVSNLMKTFASSGATVSSKLESPVVTRSKTRVGPSGYGTPITKLSEKTLQADESLKQLFSAGGKGTSAFRLLYNLEVLSSKLMPVGNNLANGDMALEFRERFLTVGGLSLVLGVLQEYALAKDAAYELRQSCYFIALQLSRFLLCGEAPHPDTSVKKQYLNIPLPTPCLVRSPSTPIKAMTQGKSPTPTKTLSGSKSAQLFNLTPQRESEDLEKKKYSVSVLETLSEENLRATVSCLLRLAWAAAAGKLSLATASVIVGGTGSLGRPRRGQAQGADSSTHTELQAGICTLEPSISSRDALIACEALGLLITCLELRTHALEHFMGMAGTKDFIIDVLLGCSSSEVRSQACDLFYRLSQVSPLENYSPKRFLTQVLVSTPVPLWIPSGTARSASYRLLTQCAEYFALRCRLHNCLSQGDQEFLGVSASSMLDDELAWLANFSPNEAKPSDQGDGDSALLMGHLHLVRALLTCEGVNKKEAGMKLIPDLLRQYLFPASLVIAEGPKVPRASDTLAHFSPKCRDVESRAAAYYVLVELATGCRENLEILSKKLVAIHHRFNPDMTKEFEYEPAVEGRSVSNFVGLKNAGATCYMNSVIQQLFLVPSISEAVLSVQEDEVDEDSLFFQFQMVLGHLLESKLQYYVPERFWASLRLRGQPINVREQQDAFEFFIHLVDNLDEYLAKIGKERVFRNRFGGIFSDQKICKECPHRYERESIFLALNVTVKSSTLIESLEQFVKGELLEGDNAYYCEACVQKRSAIKRLCIKTLPSTLVIQLKRFHYDWEAGRSLKFDDYLQFPWTLDMKPYTAEGLEEQDQQQEDIDGAEVSTSAANPSSYMYELVGIVVHSGQANAGHYYSFIKERRSTSPYVGSKSKWYKFNDTSVEEVEMTDQALEAEAFGGTYKARQNDASGFPETRQRYWNAYMLLYDRVDETVGKSRAVTTPRRTINRAKSLRNPTGREKKPVLTPRGSDSLSQLSELLHAGEERGIFAGTERMPLKILQNIREENLEFMKSKDVFSQEYYRFIHQLVSANVDKIGDSTYGQMCTISVNLLLNFLFHTYFRLRHRESDIDLHEWVESFSRLSRGGPQIIQWTIDKLSSDAMIVHVKPFLLECPIKEIRQTFADLVGHALANYHRLLGESHVSTSLQRYLKYLIKLLEGDVSNHSKNCAQYFNLLLNYSQMGIVQKSLLLQNNIFRLLLVFLLGCDFVEGSYTRNVVSPPMGSPCGPSGPNKIAKTAAIPLPALSPPATIQRRWTVSQIRDFGDIHSLIADLLISCNFSSHCDSVNDVPQATEENIGLEPTADVLKYVFGEGQGLFLQEMVTTCRQNLSVINENPSLVAEMFAHLSMNNKVFSKSLMKEILFQISTGSASELKNLFALLQYLLAISDEVQHERAQWVIDGFSDPDSSNVGGMLAMISNQNTSDSRRAYQLIKFIVNLAARLPSAKDNILQAPARWQLAVNWLKKKMESSAFWTGNQDNDCSNEDSNTRIFQRTTSAQVTLEEATALLTDCETSDMEMDNASEIDPCQDVRFDVGDTEE
ncbi:ubiquitin carboxyl-terminal hydrolase 24-like [Artemia franciscana]|uniref:ubiquitinyl hydrolase 1 n=1 Tax=Artemia franciscana TaxID=6661 RepID=A0AA88KWE2_ARTSF|nr:hypothetical protein QYM36_016940 [Artemia franciscana]